jgi:hypothetical protein
MKKKNNASSDSLLLAYFGSLIDLWAKTPFNFTRNEWYTEIEIIIWVHESELEGGRTGARPSGEYRRWRWNQDRPRRIVRLWVRLCASAQSTSTLPPFLRSLLLGHWAWMSCDNILQFRCFGQLVFHHDSWRTLQQMNWRCDVMWYPTINKFILIIDGQIYFHSEFRKGNNIVFSPHQNH